MNISRRDILKYCVGSAAALGLELSILGTMEEVLAAGGSPLILGNTHNVPSYPIAAHVYTTLDKTVKPKDLPPGTTRLRPRQVSEYAANHYGEWGDGPGFPFLRPDMQTGETEPAVPDPAATPLLSFFTISDIHICDKESPAQCIYDGYNYPYTRTPPTGTPPNYPVGNSSAYSAVILYTTHVLDAAVQTVNAIHNQTPFDFGILLGDAVNNTQYNELRWYIDVLDGKEISPSSGDHIGSGNIDYQKPYQAAGLNKSIPWYQVVGNHDQFYMGSFLENDYIRSLRIGDTIQNASSNMSLPPSPDIHGYYMGVVDGSAPDGEIRGVGPEANFASPPKVAPDPNRHSLSATNIVNGITSGSSTLNWMNEFFNTTSTPVGHGFTQANLDSDFACYSFEPKTNMPIRVLVLDDTCKANANAQVPYYAQGCVDQQRYDWLVSELDRGQADGMLMVIAAHVPIAPQTTQTNPAPMDIFYNPPPPDPHSIKTDNQLLATLHNYPNLMLWIAGHRHLNTITPQPSSDPSHPENGFWEVETASLRDFPQQFRTFNIVRNSDNTISILAIDVDPAVREGSPAELSRSKAIGIQRILGGLSTFEDTTSHAYNAELVKQLTPEMQAKIASY